MPDLSKIKINGINYSIKDATARSNIDSIPTWAKASSAPVISVNGLTGAVTVDKIQTTAGDNTTEYNLIGTVTTNANTTAVSLYNPTLLSFAKYTNNFARLTIGSTSTPGGIRIYTNTSGASGYVDLKANVSGTNERTITLPDANGTVALTSDIPNVPSWAMAVTKPTYTASEVGAVTSSEVSTMISGLSGFSTVVVSSLPATGELGTFYLVSNGGSGTNIYDEYIWLGNNFEKLGSLNTGSMDLSGYLLKTDIAAWAKAANKPTYTANEVGALPSSTTYVSSFNGSSGAITYVPPVSSVNGKTGVVTINIPVDVSELNNDAGYLTLATLPKYDGTVV
ncbi:MAG: hypothetical protein J6T34_05470 [Bacilli bacterium]|nr:hypothetical protein [Bacilli bacterium]